MGRTCILHVGTEKTGSTSIQRFLGLNRESLEQGGIYVPRCLTPFADEKLFNHAALSAIVRQDDADLDDIDQLLGLLRKSDRPAFAAAALEDLRSEIRLKPDCGTFVLSSEHIHSRVFPSGRLEVLREVLQPHFDQITVVVYLRDQYEMARSLINTALRRGISVQHCIPILEGFEEPDPVLGVSRGYFDLKSFVEALAASFGRQNLRVRLFPEKLPPPHLIADFCKAASLTVTDPNYPLRENASFTAAGSHLFQRVNEIVARHRRNRSDLAEHLAHYLSSQHAGDGLVAASSEIAAFRELFANDNELVRREWFPDRPKLFEPRPDSPADGLAPSRDEALSVLINYALWREDSVQAELRSTREALRLAQLELRSAQDELRSAQEALRLTRTSTSWVLTAPLRAMRTMLMREALTGYMLEGKAGLALGSSHNSGRP